MKIFDRLKNLAKRLFQSREEISPIEKEKIKEIKEKERKKTVGDYLRYEEEDLYNTLKEVGEYYSKTGDKGLRDIFERLLFAALFREGGIYGIGGRIYLDNGILENILKKSGVKDLENSKKEWKKRITDRIVDIYVAGDIYIARLWQLIAYSHEVRGKKGLKSY
jgi:hypothetical protein